MRPLKEIELKQGSDGNVIGAEGSDQPVDPYSNAGPAGTGRSLVDHNIPTWMAFQRGLSKCLEGTTATDDRLSKVSLGMRLVPGPGQTIYPFENALKRLRNLAQGCHESGNKVIFVGNGGSAAICSHMAVDWTKNGGIRSIALNDAPTLTCLANDFGYENVFSKQLEYYASPNDLVIIISSSGKSQNILSAARWCSDKRVTCVTFSGMNHNNALRLRGAINFYVPVMDYGLTELTHACLLHSIVSVKWV